MQTSVLISVVRTAVVPTIVGWIIQFLVFLNSDPSPETRAMIMAIVAICWYTLALFLSKVNPKWGVLLLIAASPKYVETGEGDHARAREELLRPIIRTVVPIVAGWAITALARWGFSIDTASAVLWLQGVVTTGYYALLRKIESIGQKKAVIEANATLQPAKVPTSAKVAGALLGGPAALTY